ncbi:MAG: penicillin-insensitive murein endopeptidase [Polyangiaceae bacterium]|nr:penicillin-insensitive murein endopeptidase [Polyangiaceae bacterium]
MRRLAAALSIALAGALAHAAPTPRVTASVSKGHPNSGKLSGGKRWTNTKWARQRPGRAGSWGTPEMVRLLQSSAHKVAGKHPRSVLMIGDLSAREGGPLPGHHSHQSGRDADVGFYLRDSRDRHVVLERFVAIDQHGDARGDKRVHFDDARNWELVAAWLGDGRVEVRGVFVAGWLKARLLRRAEEARAPKTLIERAQMLLMQPPNAESHDDHFHLRIACAAGQRGVCFDDSIDRAPRSPGGLSSPSGAIE